MGFEEEGGGVEVEDEEDGVGVEAETETEGVRVRPAEGERVRVGENGLARKEKALAVLPWRESMLMAFSFAWSMRGRRL